MFYLSSTDKEIFPKILKFLLYLKENENDLSKGHKYWRLKNSQKRGVTGFYEICKLSETDTKLALRIMSFVCKAKTFDVFEEHIMCEDSSLFQLLIEEFEIDFKVDDTPEVKKIQEEEEWDKLSNLKFLIEEEELNMDEKKKLFKWVVDLVLN